MIILNYTVGMSLSQLEQETNNVFRSMIETEADRRKIDRELSDIGIAISSKVRSAKSLIAQDEIRSREEAAVADRIGILQERSDAMTHNLLELEKYANMLYIVSQLRVAKEISEIGGAIADVGHSSL